MAKRLNGKAHAARLEDWLGATIKARRAAAGPRAARPPGLAVVRVGEDAASGVYVARKTAACHRVGIHSCGGHYPATIRQEELLGTIEGFNRDPAVDAILLQLPIPVGLNARELLLAIDPNKDADGLHPLNLGRLMRGEPGLRSCTPAGVMALLKGQGIPLEGKRALVIGRSILVGQPLAVMLQQANATVTAAHSRSRDLDACCREAELVVAAAGQPGLVGANWIRPGAVVVDVGIHRLPPSQPGQPGRLCGDVRFEEVEPLADYVTPVPGGVGPMTVAMLLFNTVQAWSARCLDMPLLLPERW